MTEQSDRPDGDGLREAAAPFAKLGGSAPENAAFWDLPSDTVIYHDSMGAAITAGEVRTLRRALAAPPTRDGAEGAGNLLERVRNYLNSVCRESELARDLSKEITVVLAASRSAMRQEGELRRTYAIEHQCPNYNERLLCNLTANGETCLCLAAVHAAPPKPAPDANKICLDQTYCKFPNCKCPIVITPDAMRKALEQIEAMQVGHAATIAREVLNATVPMPPADVAAAKLADRAEGCLNSRNSAYPSDVLRECVAFLRALPSPVVATEPVAWQKRNANNDWSDIKDCSDQNLRALDNAGWETRPLYATSPVRGGGPDHLLSLPMTKQPLYLIAHIVRDEPAFDIAIQLCDHDSEEPCQPNCGLYPDCKGEWWIIPTSGHRAYPYWTIRLEDIDDTHNLKLDGSGISDYTDGPPVPPEDWIDHYKYNSHLLESKETIQNAKDLLSAIGFDNLKPTIAALGLRSAPIRRRV